MILKSGLFAFCIADSFSNTQASGSWGPERHSHGVAPLIAGEPRTRSVLQNYFDELDEFYGPIDIFRDTINGRLAGAIDQLDWKRAHDLVAQGVDPNCRYVHQVLADVACEGNAEIVRQIVRLGVSVDGSEFFSPLFEAAQCLRVGTVKLLIKLGANPNGPTNSSFTPIQAIGLRGHPEIIRALVVAGATWESVSLPEVIDSDVVHENVNFLTAVQDREAGSLDAAIEYLSNFQDAGADEIIEIISRRFRETQGTLTWNLSVLSMAFRLAEQGFDLLSDEVAPLILNGEWLPMRIAVVRRGVAVLAKMGIRLVQFSHVAARFLLEDNIETLFQTEGVDPIRTISVLSEAYNLYQQGVGQLTDGAASPMLEKVQALLQIPLFRKGMKVLQRSDSVGLNSNALLPKLFSI